IDGISIKDIYTYDLRRLISIVSQDIILFNTTIIENIRMGKPDASFKEVVEAAKVAYAHDFIEELPEGYNTIVGERGIKLSGGQKQRIAIARAIIKDPPILILDEATSSLDSVSEQLVQKALEEIMYNRTTIIVAHRLSTIRGATKIAVLEGGTIVDIGTHEQLMERNHVYSNFYKTLSIANS
ncbi:MAG: ATP-binding cassette domain-containing protein, partial [Nitrospirae bacterium]